MQNKKTGFFGYEKSEKSIIKKLGEIKKHQV